MSVAKMKCIAPYEKINYNQTKYKIYKGISGICK